MKFLFKYSIFDLLILQGILFFSIFSWYFRKPWRIVLTIEESSIGQWDYVSFNGNGDIEAGNIEDDLFIFSVQRKTFEKKKSRKGAFLMFENTIEESGSKKFIYDNKNEKISLVDKETGKTLFESKFFSAAPLGSFSEKGDRFWVEGPQRSILVYENFFPEPWWGHFFRLEIWGWIFFLSLGLVKFFLGRSTAKLDNQRSPVFP